MLDLTALDNEGFVLIFKIIAMLIIVGGLFYFIRRGFEQFIALKTWKAVIDELLFCVILITGIFIVFIFKPSQIFGTIFLGLFFVWDNILVPILRLFGLPV